MTKVVVGEDCGNSPKALLLRDLNIAFAKNNVPFILEHVTDDITWIMVGDQTIQGKANFAAVLERMKDNEVAEVRLDNIITHGDTGAVNGCLKMKDGNTYAFCDVYKFNGHSKAAKIREITSYNIEIKGQ
jgi:hypothetical protein